ncbi:MAG: DUF805 domain-containing protein [Gammaproteobacteria bacterium]
MLGQFLILRKLTFIGKFVWAVERCFRNYAVIKTRASSEEFRYWFLFFLLGFVSLVIASHPILLNLFLIVTLIPSLSVICRRLHDANCSSAWLWIPLFFGSLFFVCHRMGEKILELMVAELEMNVPLEANVWLEGFTWSSLGITFIFLYLLAGFLMRKSYAEANKYGDPALDFSQVTKIFKEQVVTKSKAIKEKAVAKGGEIKEKAVTKGGEIKEKAVARGGEIKDKAVTRGGEIKEKAAIRGGKIKEKIMAGSKAIKEKAMARGGEIKEKVVTGSGKIKEKIRGEE